MFRTKCATISPTWTLSCQGSRWSTTTRSLPLILRTTGTVSSERIAPSACTRRGYRRDERQGVCPASLWLAGALSMGRRAGDARAVGWLSTV